MGISLNIPSDKEQTLRQAWGGDLDRAALEALIIEGYRSARLSIGEVADLLNFATRFEAEEWLTGRGVQSNYDLDELRADRQILGAIFPETLR